MRAQTIAQLSWYKPRSGNTARLSAGTDVRGVTQEAAADILHYAECYRNLQFGWDFARDMAETGAEFPSILHGDDLIVWEAYQYIKGNRDRDVAEALAINADINSNLRNQIRALLVVDGIDIETIAEKLGVPEDTVRAYEKLFFNVLDRKADHQYIANLVYPEGRMAEAFENYLENTGLDDLMLRAGYTHGKAHVLYAAGLGPNPYAGKSAGEGASELDSMFMADGCLYATLGWMHQRTNAQPIVNARLSMQASKMGGTDLDSDVGMITMGDTMRDEIRRMGQVRAQLMAKAEREEPPGS